MDNSEYLPFPKSFTTKAIHSGQDPEQWDSLAVVPPIVLSTTFKETDDPNENNYLYGREGNPSRSTLETCLTSLENAKHAVCFSSGMAATSAVLSLLKPGDHVICGHVIYGGSYYLFTEHVAKLDIEFSFIDVSNIEEVKSEIKKNTKLVWIESPTNPSLTVTDIRALAKVTKAHDVLLAVDNTFLTPYLQRPLELGADVSVYSLTKYMNGHSDVIMGAVVTNRDDLSERLRNVQIYCGGVPAPFDCSMVLRSLKTLALRMRQHSANSLAVAKYLEAHEMVEKVLHPGLPSHPQHALSKSQTSGHSGMVAAYIKGGLEETKKFVFGLKVFSHAASLGGLESLVGIPAISSQAQMAPEERQRLGITDNLVRLSVGIEDTEDLIADLEQALRF